MFCYGMPVLIELETLADNLRLGRELGLSFVELHMSLPSCSPASLRPSHVRELASDLDVELTVHLPEELDFGSHLEPMRLASVQVASEALEWAAECGIHIATAHLGAGTYFTLPEGRVYVNDIFRERFIASVQESFAALLSVSRETNVRLCLENAWGRLFFLEEAVRQLAEEASISFTWDVGHDAASGYSDGRLLTQYQSRIAHVHLHDFDGVSDHQPLFTGTVDLMEPILLAQQEELRVCIEVKTEDALRQSVEALRERALTDG